MAPKYGQWIREPRSADCPECESDSMPIRHIADLGVEERRCDEGHLFTAQAWVTGKLSESDRFD